MMSAQHTPGPWAVETVKTQIGHAHKISGCNACIYVDHRDVMEPDEKTTHALANARLIAAAPELLALALKVRALEQSTQGKGMLDLSTVDLAHIYRDAVAAITKAGGGK